MNWYPRYPGDYRKDTADLTLSEHGAYSLLLDHYYSNQGDMPTDHTKLVRICSASGAEECSAVAAIADRFFPVNGDGKRHNRRADKEIVRASEIVDKRKNAADMRWHNKSNANACANDMQVHTQATSYKPQVTDTGDTHTPTGVEGGSQKALAKKPVEMPFDSEAFRDAWRAWVDHRKQLRKPMTDRAQRLIIGKLPATESEAIRWIDNAIERGWLGIFDPSNSNTHVRASVQASGARRELYTAAPPGKYEAMLKNAGKGEG